MPYAIGGFADIWKCQQDGNQVCVKAFRTHARTDLGKIKQVCGSSLFERGVWTQPDPNQRFYREIVAWKYVSHSNVLPFLGVSESLFSFSIISPWMSNGNIVEYTTKNRGVNRLQLVHDHRDQQSII